jgi:hypothetical protein
MAPATSSGEASKKGHSTATKTPLDSFFDRFAFFNKKGSKKKSNASFAGRSVTSLDGGAYPIVSSPSSPAEALSDAEYLNARAKSAELPRK